MQVELTKNEAKVINMMTEGLTVNQIAQRMNVKPSYIGQMMYDVRKKNGCKSSVQLIAKLFREEFLR
jgi:DNA-binding CsgD family transcriptional regulator